MSHRPIFDYRVVKKVYLLNHSQTEEYFTICQVWYNGNGEIETYSEEGIVPTGDNIEFLTEEINTMKLALKKPILEEYEIAPCVMELREVQKGMTWNEFSKSSVETQAEYLSKRNPTWNKDSLVKIFSQQDSGWPQAKFKKSGKKCKLR